jgi:flagellar protein FlbD
MVFYIMGGLMIKLTGLNKKEFILNAETIEKIEEVPDTLITLINGKKYLVLDSTEVIIAKVLKYKKKIFTGEL